MGVIRRTVSMERSRWNRGVPRYWGLDSWVWLGATEGLVAGETGVVGDRLTVLNSLTHVEGVPYAINLKDP
jgi:hypothetical protein